MNTLNLQKRALFAALFIFSISCHGIEKTTVLIVGDSLSSGYGLQPGEGWVHLLSEKLEQLEKNIELVNDSISGDTTAGGLARIKAGLQRHNPDWVIIELGGNDGLRGMSLKAMRSNFEQMIQIVRDYGASPILFGVQLPPNYGTAYINAFTQVYVKASESTSTPLLTSIMEGVGVQTELMQDDGIHPNARAQPIMRDLIWTFLQRYL